MIDYNRKLSNERETQDPSHNMSTLVQFETQTLLKLVSISYYFLFFKQSESMYWDDVDPHLCTGGSPPPPPPPVKF